VANKGIGDGTGESGPSTPKPGSRGRIQVAASAIALSGVLAIAPIGRTGFNVPGAVAGLVLLALAALIYWRSVVALAVATMAMLSVVIYALLTDPLGAVVLLPFLVACLQAFPPMWAYRLERVRHKAPANARPTVAIGAAPFWRRTVAALLDLVFYVVAWWAADILLTLAFAVSGAFDVTSPTPAMYEALVGPFYVIGLIVNVAYFVGFWTLLGRTPGMMLTQLGVVTETNQKLSVVRAFLRYLVFIPSCLVVIGVLWPLWDRRQQAWHDKAAHSHVVKMQRLATSD
jgi:uncharacterized RDD family membrane protein YckC